MVDRSGVLRIHTAAGRGVFLACIAVMAVCLAATGPGAVWAAGGEGPKDDVRTPLSAPCLLIHLDAVNAETFFDEYDNGRLPNLHAFFRDGRVARRAISPFAAGTETVYPRLKNGADVTDLLPVGWDYYERSTGERRTQGRTFVELFSMVPRYAITQPLHGIPGLDLIAGVALLNSPRLLRDYSIVEFFWFATDSLGHSKGRESQILSLQRFDAFFGLLIRELAGAPVNVAIYADHGMSPIDEFVDVNMVMQRAAGDLLLMCEYPNLYLADPGEASVVAERVAQDGVVDFVFYRHDDSTVVGIHGAGQVVFTMQPSGAIAYTSHGEDPFGYAALGYAGEALSDHEWLHMTAESRYPAVPAQIVHYMANRNTGDVVTVVNSPRGIPDAFGHASSHTGFLDSDCTVPVLIAGPDFQLLDVPDAFWVHTLYRDVLAIDPRKPTMAAREPDHVWVSASGVEAAISPALGTYLRGSLGPADWSVIGEVSAFRTSILRGWIGAGLAARRPHAASANPGSAHLVLSGRLEVFAGPFAYEWRNILDTTGRSSRHSLSIDVSDWAMIRWTSPNMISVGVAW